MGFFKNFFQTFVRLTAKGFSDTTLNGLVSEAKAEIDKSKAFKPAEKELLKKGVDLLAKRVRAKLGVTQ